MRNCDFNNDAMTCDACGFRSPLRQARRNCPTKFDRSIGLGDFVAACLSVIGVTKERVSRWLGYDCGCAQRQARWNELGWHFVAIVRRRIGIG